MNVIFFSAFSLLFWWNKKKKEKESQSKREKVDCKHKVKVRINSIECEADKSRKTAMRIDAEKREYMKKAKNK